MSVPLPVKHRPRVFGDVVGQVSARRTLEAMVSSGRVPPQLLLAGPSGCGKTTLARIVAAAVLCSGRSGPDPCGSCPSCRLVHSGSHPDLLEVDAASYGGKDSILELSGRSALLPVMGVSRVFVVDEAHGLTSAAAQAFLKTLEEPYEGVFFLFCTTDPDRILPTVRSRCVEMHLSLPSRDERASLASKVASLEGWLLEPGTALALVDAVDPATGVRGLLNGLAKVAPASSGRISPSDVALLVGGGGAAVSQVVAALEAGDAAGALAALDVSRMSSSDGSLVSGLARWCRARLLSEFSSPRLEVWCRLMAELSRAEGFALEAWVVGAAHACLASASRPAPQPGPTSDASSDVGPDRGYVGPEASARLLAAASPHADVLPELLGRCSVRETPEAVELEVPSRIYAAVEAQLPALRTAAGRLGLPLRVSAV